MGQLVDATNMSLKISLKLCNLFFRTHTPALKGGTRVPKYVQNSVLGNILVLAR